MSIPQAGYTARRCVSRYAVVMPVGQSDWGVRLEGGALRIKYGGSRGDRGCEWNVKDVVFSYICGLTPGMLFNYLVAGVVAKTYTHTQLYVIAKKKKKSRPGLDGLNGHVPPVLRGNVLLCCERSFPLSGAPAWGQTGGC